MERQASSQSVERTVVVLDYVASHGGAGCRLGDVVSGTPLGKATAHRFLRDLVSMGLLDYDSESGRYFLGIRLVALGEVAANRFGIANIARNVMDRLALETEDTIYLALRDGFDAICVARAEGSYPIKILTLQAGDRRPLGVGAGPLAMLMACPGEEAAAIIENNAPRYAQFGMTEVIVEEMLQTSLEHGYALNLGRMVPDMVGLGVPLKDHAGRPFAALSIAAVASRMGSDRIPRLMEMLNDTAAEISKSVEPLLHQHLSPSRRQKILNG